MRTEATARSKARKAEFEKLLKEFPNAVRSQGYVFLNGDTADMRRANLYALSQ